MSGRRHADPDDDPYAAAALAAEALRERTAGVEHRVAVVLGSGWAPAADVLGAPAQVFPVAGLPGFAPLRAPGHPGTVRSVPVAGAGHSALVFLGRVHLYEGHSAAHVVHPVRTAIHAGCTTVVLTNAAGGVNAGYRPGDLVLIADHLNLTGRSPLAGPRFTDLSEAYSARLRACCTRLRPDLAEGVYAQFPGPHFETPAEIRMARLLGADLVGMSTALEAIAARELGADVLGVSLVTNPAAGITGQPVSPLDVLALGARAAPGLGRFLADVIAAEDFARR